MTQRVARMGEEPQLLTVAARLTPVQQIRAVGLLHERRGDPRITPARALHVMQEFLAACRAGSRA